MKKADCAVCFFVLNVPNHPVGYAATPPGRGMVPRQLNAIPLFGGVDCCKMKCRYDFVWAARRGGRIEVQQNGRQVAAPTWCDVAL